MNVVFLASPPIGGRFEGTTYNLLTGAGVLLPDDDEPELPELLLEEELLFELLPDELLLLLLPLKISLRMLPELLLLFELSFLGAV